MALEQVAQTAGAGRESDGWRFPTRLFISELIGTLLAVLACNSLASRLEAAKLYYFETDRSGLLRRTSRGPLSAA